MIERDIVLAHGLLLMLAGGLNRNPRELKASCILINAASHLISPMEPYAGSVDAYWESYPSLEVAA